jgi:hypothetical protein
MEDYKKSQILTLLDKGDLSLSRFEGRFGTSQGN